MPNSILPISILTLLFLMDITVGLLGFEFTQQYIGAAYFFFFHGYFRLLAIQRIILLEVAIFSQMIGYALFFNTTSPPVGIFLTSLTCLSLFLYTLLIHKCISIKKKTLFLLGPLFVIPYWIVLAYHIKENFFDWAGNNQKAYNHLSDGWDCCLFCSKTQYKISNPFSCFFTYTNQLYFNRLSFSWSNLYKI